MKFTPLLPVFLLIITGCSITTVELPNSCKENDVTCKRNLYARTLTMLGQEEAAINLLCKDPDIIDSLGDSCPGE